MFNKNEFIQQKLDEGCLRVWMHSWTYKDWLIDAKMLINNPSHRDWNKLLPYYYDGAKRPGENRLGGGGGNWTWGTNIPGIHQDFC